MRLSKLHLPTVGALLALVMGSPEPGFGVSALQAETAKDPVVFKDAWDRAGDPRIDRDQGALSFVEYRAMTAREIASVVESLTGFYHPGYESNEGFIGYMDRSTGRRQPPGFSSAGLLILKRLALDVAGRVMIRERVLPTASRVVFPGVDFGSILSPEQVAALVGDLQWKFLLVSPEPVVTELLVARFLERQQETSLLEACGDLLATFLQHGGVFHL